MLYATNIDDMYAADMYAFDMYATSMYASDMYAPDMYANRNASDMTLHAVSYGTQGLHAYPIH